MITREELIGLITVYKTEDEKGTELREAIKSIFDEAEQLQAKVKELEAELSSYTDDVVAEFEGKFFGDGISNGIEAIDTINVEHQCEDDKFYQVTITEVKDK